MLMFLKSLLFVVVLLTPLASHATKVQVEYEKGTKGTPSRMQSEGIIEGAPQQVWEAIARLNNWGSYMPQMPISFFVSEEGAQIIQRAETRNANLLTKLARKYRIEGGRRPGGRWEGIVFQVVDLPFPVENRWFLLRYLNDETKASEGRYEQCWEMVAANVNSVRGCFRISPTNNPEETRLNYEEIVDLGGHVPEWIAKIGVKQTTPDVFRNLEREVEKLSAEVNQQD